MHFQSKTSFEGFAGLVCLMPFKAAFGSAMADTAPTVRGSSVVELWLPAAGQRLGGGARSAATRLVVVQKP